MCCKVLVSLFRVDFHESISTFESLFSKWLKSSCKDLVIFTWELAIITRECFDQVGPVEGGGEVSWFTIAVVGLAVAKRLTQANDASRLQVAFALQSLSSLRFALFGLFSTHLLVAQQIDAVFFRMCSFYLGIWSENWGKGFVHFDILLLRAFELLL